MPEDARFLEFAQRFADRFLDQDRVERRIERLFDRIERISQDNAEIDLDRVENVVQNIAARRIERFQERLQDRIDRLQEEADRPDPGSFDYQDGGFDVL